MATFNFVFHNISQLMSFVAISESRDVLGLLLATTVIVPAMKALKTSPIIGFLLIGLLLGPSGLNVVQNVHLMHKLGDLGIIFFLFEMGLELSLKKVISMKADVFGLGSIQYIFSGLAMAGCAKLCIPSLEPNAMVVLGGALALSSSAFVLQLLRDNAQLGTQYGRAAFGVLLFQDLAVVPLLVVLPVLVNAGSGASIVSALGAAVGRAALALGILGTAGHFILRPAFSVVAHSKSSEAFLGLTLAMVLMCSAVTEGLGLSNTLGAFYGGVLLSETDFRHQVEADIAPFRGLLLGLFFVTVGFSIDLHLIARAWIELLPIIFGMMAVKGLIVAGAALSPPFNLSGASAVQAATLLAPGGEFAFVVLGLAERLELLSPLMSQLLVTAIALSMGMTPLMAKIGDKIAVDIRNRRGSENVEGKDGNAAADVLKVTSASRGFVVVCGFGRFGRTVCELLQAEGESPAIVFENKAEKAMQARSQGLPVFWVDATRREVLENFNVGEARLVVVAVRQRADINKITQSIRGLYPALPMLVRAEDEQHRCYLRDCYRVNAVVPAMPSDSKVLSLLFGSRVLELLNVPEDEVQGLVEEFRRKSFSEGAMFTLREDVIENEAIIARLAEEQAAEEAAAAEMQEMMAAALEAEAETGADDESLPG